MRTLIEQEAMYFMEFSSSALPHFYSHNLSNKIQANLGRRFLNKIIQTKLRIF